MKFVKNRITQILAVGILLIVTIAGLYYFSKPVFADDKISMKNFNEKNGGCEFENRRTRRKDCQFRTRTCCENRKFRTRKRKT